MLMRKDAVTQHHVPGAHRGRLIDVGLRLRSRRRSAPGNSFPQIEETRMRLLITGGTGFIGSRLATRARELGHETRVTGMANKPGEGANNERLGQAGIDVLLASLKEVAASPAEALAGVDVVIHLAAAQHEMNVPDEHFREVNVRGTEALLEAARQAGVRRFVH